tara:strand:- start:361 stop:846 length:486 start_codon:yes stop_codon:yes gene_type:complete
LVIPREADNRVLLLLLLRVSADFYVARPSISVIRKYGQVCFALCARKYLRGCVKNNLHPASKAGFAHGNAYFYRRLGFGAALSLKDTLYSSLSKIALRRFAFCMGLIAECMVWGVLIYRVMKVFRVCARASGFAAATSFGLLAPDFGDGAVRSCPGIIAPK